MINEIPDKEFLEEKPLYTKFQFEIPNFLHDIPKVNINMYCNKCREIRTFVLKSDYKDIKYYLSENYKPNISIQNNIPIVTRPVSFSKDAGILLLVYLCASCEKFYRYFLIKMGEDSKYLQKIGQFPSFKRSISKEIRENLGDYIDYYEKGQMLEFHGYGIGAYVYYRRIVEGIIDNLLEKIEFHLSENKKNEYEEALKIAKKEKNATKKIEIVKDLIPDQLIRGKYNPLKTLHDALSIGIHDESDEVILNNAQILRNTLTLFIEGIFESEQKFKNYEENMDKILKKLEEYKKN